VETVLGDTLEAICVENIDQFSSALSTLEESNVSLIETAKGAAVSQIDSAAAGLLIEKVSSDIALSQFLHGIRCTDTLDEALNMRQSLSSDETVYG